MQNFDLILNVHGEQPGAPTLRAEAEYTPVIRKIHSAFPSLRIVLEHISTREGLEIVRQCGPVVWRFHLGLVFVRKATISD